MKFFTSIRRYGAVPFAAGVCSASLCFPSFAAEGAASTGDFTGLLTIFSQVSAWMWKEIGLLLTWILSQPILMLAMSLFFIGAIVAFFMRVYHSV